MTSDAQTILIWPRLGGFLAAFWNPNRSAPYDVAWGATAGEAVSRLDLRPVA